MFNMLLQLIISHPGILLSVFKCWDKIKWNLWPIWTGRFSLFYFPITLSRRSHENNQISPSNISSLRIKMKSCVKGGQPCCVCHNWMRNERIVLIAVLNVKKIRIRLKQPIPFFSTSFDEFFILKFFRTEMWRMIIWNRFVTHSTSQIDWNHSNGSECTNRCVWVGK